MPLADSTNGIRAVLFDVDGTLVDTLPALIPGLADAFATYAEQCPSELEIRSIIGLPLIQQMQMFEQGSPTSEEIQKRVAFAIERFEHYKDLERPFGPAIQALIQLQREGFAIGLVTSKSRIELESFLDRFDGAAFVDAAICSSDVVHPKPHAESALLACERLGVSPKEAVLIGDSVFDIQCARNAKVRAAIAVTYGAGATSALLAEAPDLVFDTPEALLEWATQLSKTPCLEARS